MKYLRTKWILANLVGFTTGGVLHTMFAHGLTGSHEFWLTLPQFVMHTVGFLALGITAGLAQRQVLKPFVQLSVGSVLLKALLMTAGFWVGYYSGGIPLDIIVGFTVFGLITGLQLHSKTRGGKQWAWASSVGYFAASLILIAILAPFVEWLFATFGKGLAGDLSIWISVGITGGTAAGMLTAPFLVRSLQPEGWDATNLRTAEGLG